MLIQKFVGATVAVTLIAGCGSFTDGEPSLEDHDTFQATADSTGQIGTQASALVSDSWPIFADETGTVYAINSSNQLLWYRDIYRNNTSSWRWHTNSGANIGSGWANTKFVFSGGQGRIYWVTSSGVLRYYHDTLNDGTTTNWYGWGTGSGNQIGCGWHAFTHVFSPNHSGVILARDAAGKMYWYRDNARNGSNGSCGASGWAAASGCDLTLHDTSYRAKFARGRIFTAGPVDNSITMLDGVDNSLWVFHYNDAYLNAQGQCEGGFFFDPGYRESAQIGAPGWGTTYTVLTSGGKMPSSYDWRVMYARDTSGYLRWFGTSPKEATYFPFEFGWMPGSSMIVGNGWLF